MGRRITRSDNKATAAQGVRLVPKIGGNYGKDNVRFEAGEEHDFPADVAEALLDQGLAEHGPIVPEQEA